MWLLAWAVQDSLIVPGSMPAFSRGSFFSGHTRVVLSQGWAEGT